MLYLDYSRKAGEWLPNIHGGNENLEAIDVLRKMNELVHQVPGVITAAEESTAFPGVSRPVYLNGLGFTLKWNMGWMHDMLNTFRTDPIYRKYHQNDITFSMVYAFTRKFRSSDLARRGGLWQKRAARQDAGRRVAAVRQCTRFSGLYVGASRQEAGVHGFGVWPDLGMEFREQSSGGCSHHEVHRKLQLFCKSAERAVSEREPALYEMDFHWEGFEWIDFHDFDNSIIAFIRHAKDRRRLPGICLQLHAASASRISSGTSRADRIPGDLQLRCRSYSAAATWGMAGVSSRKLFRPTAGRLQLKWSFPRSASWH